MQRKYSLIDLFLAAVLAAASYLLFNFSVDELVSLSGVFLFIKMKLMRNYKVLLKVPTWPHQSITRKIPCLLTRFINAMT